MSPRFTDHPVVVIDGPAGLTAAYDLSRRGEPVVVCERDEQVGGLARTIVRDGFRFDIGGHRFFTKSEVVREMWRDVLGADLLRRPRLSRIYYRGRFFDYPLKPFNVVYGLGLRTSAAILLSYLWVRLRPVRPEMSFADWVSNRFGRRLYHVFRPTRRRSGHSAGHNRRAVGDAADQGIVAGVGRAAYAPAVPAVR